MSKQPRALELADQLRARYGASVPTAQAAAELRRLHSLNAELMEALMAYRTARAMPSYGDYAAIPWESKAGAVNPSWGGGDCAVHGRWYGRCYGCGDEWEKLMKQSDRDAVHARDNALRAADEKARAAIAKAKEAQQ